MSTWVRWSSSWSWWRVARFYAAERVVERALEDLRGSGVADLGRRTVPAMASRIENGGSENDRWTAALSNLVEIGNSIGVLEDLLLGKAVYVDEDAFAQASAQSQQFRAVKAQERRIRDLEKELDAAVTASRLARVEKREAENLHRQAEARSQEVLRELEDTSQVFKLHMEELRLKQAEVEKKDADIKVLQAIIDTMRTEPRGSRQKKPS
ncbi:hypothetical protein R1sor_010409 [Riccia sorocarpa]|uniref:Uncharacterized protein n=1 Tax=Riccia sorocarpa TaxID=122646 RepID=A0ABD3HXZ1_9MARC